MEVNRCDRAVTESIADGNQNGTLFIEEKDKNYLSRLKLMFWTNFLRLVHIL